MSGRDTILSVYGPMARSVEDLALWMKAHLDPQHHNEDPYMRYVPFDTTKYLETCKKKLKIGYFTSLDLLETTDASKRAVLEAVSILKKANHEVV